MKRFKPKEIIALVIIAVLIIATITVGAIVIVGNVNEANEKLETTTAQQAETVIVTDEEGNTIVETVTQAQEEETTEEASEVEEATSKSIASNKATEETTKSSTKSTTKAPTKASNNKNSNTNNNTSNKSDAIEQIIPETTPVDTNEDVLKINGVECNVGNTVTITLDLKTPKVLENFQGFTTYDDKYLEFVSVTGNVGGGMFNNKDSVIYYNGSDINKGYNFTQTGTLYTATFKVLKSGSTQIKNTIEVLSDQSSNDVSPDDCKTTIGIFN